VKKEVYGNAPKKLAIISNYIVMLRCYTRDSLSFVHLCDVWSYTQEIWTKIHISVRLPWKKCGNAVSARKNCVRKPFTRVPAQLHTWLLVSIEAMDSLGMHPVGGIVVAYSFQLSLVGEGFLQSQASLNAIYVRQRHSPYPYDSLLTSRKIFFFLPKRCCEFQDATLSSISDFFNISSFVSNNDSTFVNNKTCEIQRVCSSSSLVRMNSRVVNNISLLLLT